jgi:hypothetical protein
MTTIAMVALTQGGSTLLAIIAAILAATALAATIPPDSTRGRRCFRATTAAGSAEAILAAVDSNLKYAGAPIVSVQAVLSPVRNAGRG